MCPTHKDYRTYQEELLKFSDWAIVLTTILSIPVIWPLTAIGNNLELPLVQVFRLFSIPVNSGWVPLFLAICWSSASSTGIVAGGTAGILGGLLAWLVSCSLNGGFSLATASGTNPLAAGNITAMMVGYRCSKDIPPDVSYHNRHCVQSTLRQQPRVENDPKYNKPPDPLGRQL